MVQNHQKLWEDYRNKELEISEPILRDLGFALDKKQVHIGGERYISGGRKLVLIGQRISDNKKVIIKLSSDPKMKEEIMKEWQGRRVLERINFAYHVFYSPPEIIFKEIQDYLILITEFIEQDCNFLDRPLQEQFFLALKGLEAQEAIHATTYEHANIIRRTFGLWQAKDYLENFDKYATYITRENNDTKKVLLAARDFIQKNLDIIGLYSDFLTHWDFVPHNIRVSNHNIYLLDHCSLRFGNKYESWARFINFMALHNPVLADGLMSYVRENRKQEEFLSLKLMRVFRLAELIWYYTKSLDRAESNLLTLNKKRIDLWTNGLSLVLVGKEFSKEQIREYTDFRDSLRDQEEKERQRHLH